MLLIVVTINLAMIFTAACMYPPLWKMPSSYQYFLEPIILLLLYIPAIIWITGHSHPVVQLAVQTGIRFGIITAIIEIIHISVENFVHFKGNGESLITGIFMLVLMIMFIIAGAVGSFKSKRVLGGVLTGIWTAMLCMLLVSLYGLSQLFWSFRAIEHHDIGSPDFIRSGWSDFHAFVIADIFEACFKILLVGPIAGFTLGSAGAFIMYLFNKGYRTRHKNEISDANGLVSSDD